MASRKPGPPKVSLSPAGQKPIGAPLFGARCSILLGVLRWSVELEDDFDFLLAEVLDFLGGVSSSLSSLFSSSLELESELDDAHESSDSCSAAAPAGGRVRREDAEAMACSI